MPNRRKRRIWIGRVCIALCVLAVLGSTAQFVLADDPELSRMGLRNVVLGTSVLLLWVSLVTKTPRVATTSLGASLMLLAAHFFVG